MKELTIEEKAKAYDEALEKARLILQERGDEPDGAALLSKLFPHLRESDDERIKKKILNYLYDVHDDDEERAKWIAWLEKQGEQTSLNNIWHRANETPQIKSDNRSVAVLLCCYRIFDVKPVESWEVAHYYHEYGFLNSGQTIKENDVIRWAYLDELIEKQGKQKPNYCHHEVDLSDCSEEYRKAYYDGWNNCNQQHAQLGAEQNPTWSEEKRKEFIGELQSLMFEWSNKKENMGVCIDRHIDKLLSIVSDISDLKPAWSEEDEQAIEDAESWLDMLCGYLKNNSSQYIPVVKKVISKLKPIKDRVGCEVNYITTKDWSEEDKGNLLDVKCIIDEVWHNQRVREEIDHSGEELESLWHWLNKLWQRVEYPQNTWKPSEEQIKALTHLFDGHLVGAKLIPKDYDNLRLLLEQLKKLRKE